MLRRQIPLLFFTLALGAGSAWSDNGNSGGYDNDADGDNVRNSSYRNTRYLDHDRARDAVKQGKAAPLAALWNFLQRNYPGKVLDVDLLKFKGHLIYKVRILMKGGKLLSLRLDAKTFQIIR